jgi:hypothetical protein
MTRHGADTVESQFAAQKKNYHGGECTCNKFVNCHDCRDAFTSYQSERDKVVYSRTIEKPKFSSVKHQELAFKEVESDGGYGWVALKFKLEIGDIIQVIRQKDGRG